MQRPLDEVKIGQVVIARGVAELEDGIERGRHPAGAPGRANDERVLLAGRDWIGHVQGATKRNDTRGVTGDDVPFRLRVPRPEAQLVVAIIDAGESALVECRYIVEDGNGHREASALRAKHDVC